MGRIIITCDVDDKYADPNHEMGVTEEGFTYIVEALGICDDVQISKADLSD